MEIGARVRYIHHDTEADKASGHYPPIGTFGTVINVEADGLRVKWDEGTKGDGKWFCNHEDVELVYHYIVEVLIGTRRFSCNCDTAESVLDALAEIFTEFPRHKRDGVDFEKIINEMESGKRISYNECPIRICRINGEIT